MEVPNAIDQLDSDVEYISHIRPIPKQPRYKQYLFPEARFRTFIHSWSREFSLQAMELMKNGLFYTGKSNLLICFSCGGGFRNLNNTDDLDEIHAQFYGGCEKLQERLTLKVVDNLANKIDPSSPAFLKKQSTKTFVPDIYDLPDAVATLIKKHKAQARRQARNAKRKLRRASQLSEQTIKNQEILIDKINKKTECPICYASTVSHNINCGHTFCATCVNQIKQCPFCNAIIKNRTRIYFS